MSLAGIEVRVGATSNIRAVQRDVQQLQKTMQAAAAAQANMAKNLSAQGSQWNSKEFTDYETKLAGARAEMNRAIQASGQYYQTTRNLTTATADFNDRLARQKVRFSEVWGPSSQKMMRAAMKEQMALQNMIVKTYRRSGDKVDADIFTPNPATMPYLRNMRKELGYLAQAYSSVAVQVTNWGKNIQWAGRQLTVGFSVPLSLALGGIARLGYSLDEQLVRIEKVYGDGEALFQASSDSIKKMATDTAKHVANEWGIAGKATLDVMAELAATGLEGANLQSMTMQTQRAALLGEMSAEESLKLVRTLKEAYRQNNEEIEHSVNLFNEIENSTALTMQDISEGLPRVAGILQATGVSMEDTLVLLTGFKEAGIDVAEGANALKSINFKAIAASPTAAKNFLEITGRDIEQIVDAAGGDFMTVMYEIADIMQTLNQQEQVDLIARVFGIHQGGRTITLLNQLAEGSAGMQRAMDAAGKSAEELASTADAELTALANSLSTRFNRVKESMLITLGEIGITALDMLMPLFEGFGQFIEWLGNLPEGIKRMGIGAAIGLAVVGPLVMLVGLFANLIGMMARFGLSIIKVLAPFKILTLESKAAQILQQNFASSVDRTTTAIRNQTSVFDGLIAKLDAVQEKLTAAISVATGVPMGTYSTLPSAKTRATSGTSSVMIGPLLATQRREADGSISSLSREEWRAYEKDLARAEAATNRFGASWRGTANTIATVSGSVMLLSGMIGNELVSKVALGAMSLSALMSLAGGLSDVFKTRVAASIGAAAAKMTVFGKVGTAVLTGLATAGRALVGAVLGPIGLALGAAIAAGTYFWMKHKKEVERVKKVYDDITNSAKALGDAYGYVPGEAMQEEYKSQESWDEGTIIAQQLRMKKLREEEAEIYDTWVAYARQIRKETQGDNRAYDQQILNEAMRQGIKVLNDSGDAALAQQAAWDAFYAMTGRTVSMDQFKALTVEVGWSEDTFRNASGATAALADRIKGDLEDRFKGLKFETDFWREQRANAFGTFLGGNISVWKISDADKAAAQAEMAELMDAMLNPDIRAEQKMEWFDDVLGEMTDKWRLQYQQWQRYTGDYKTSFNDFMGDIEKNLRGMRRDDNAEPLIFGLKDIAVAETYFPLIEQTWKEQANLIGTTENASYALSGYHAVLLELSTEEEKRAIRLKYQSMLEGDNTVKRYMAIVAMNAEIAALGETRRSTDLLARASLNAADAGVGIGTGIAEGLEPAQEEIDETNRKLEELADAMVKGRRDAAEYYVDSLVDEYMKQYDAEQEAERDAVRKRHDDSIKEIEDRFDLERNALDALYDGREKALEDRQKAANKALKDQFEKESDALDDKFDAERDAQSERFEKEQDALDKRQQAEQDALDKKQDADQERLDNRQDAEMQRLEDRWEALNEQAEKDQEARRKSIEDSYDARIQAVRDVIEAEQEAEKRRQEIFDKERERIRRLSDMFGQNVDLNMALNAGDMDAAAKIANNMAATTQQWGLDDAAEISQSASEKRIKELEESIKVIEEEKKARLEALKEVENEEDKARKRKEEAEKEHLKRLHKQQDDALKETFKRQDEALKETHKLQDKALKDQQKLIDKALKDQQDAERKVLQENQAMRQENLDERYEGYKANLDKERDAEVVSLDERKTKEIAVQKERNEAEAKAVDERLEYAKEALEAEIQAKIALTPRTKGEQKMLNMGLRQIFGKHMDGQVEISDERVEQMTDNYEQRVKQSLNEFKNDQNWSGMAADIAKKMAEGVFGESVSLLEMRKFFATGELPELKKIRRSGGGSNASASFYHTGGIAGESGGGRTGFSGNSLSFSEIPANLLKGEGVLNLKAMGLPGMREFVNTANNGKFAPGTGDGEGLPFFTQLGFARAMQRNLANQISLRGFEHGAAMNQITGGVYSGTGSIAGLSSEQIANAQLIMAVGRSMGGLSERDIMIGIMTAMQESSLRNLPGGDRDSAGLFQQRPSQNWGSYAEVTNPDYAIRKFFSELMKVKDRDSMPAWLAADTVQRSAYPRLYAQHEALARELMGLNMELPDVSGMSFQDRMAAMQKAVDEAIAREDDALFGVPPAGGRMSGDGIGWRRMWEIVSKQFPHANLSSGLRPGAVTASGRLSYHGAGRATDLTSHRGKDGMMEIFNWLRSKYGAKNHELYYSPAGGRQILQGRPYNTYGTAAYNNHFDHVHWAMKNGGLVPGVGFGDKVPAMLEPKEFVMNRTATDTFLPLLHAMNTGDWSGAAVAPAIDNSGGSEYNVEVNFNGPVSSDVDIEQTIRRTFNTITRENERRRGGRRTI